MDCETGCGCATGRFKNQERKPAEPDLFDLNRRLELLEQYRADLENELVRVTGQMVALRRQVRRLHKRQAKRPTAAAAA